jgi:Dienelactone hydrolase and related enzymes
MGEWIERGLAFKEFPAGEKKVPGIILLMEAYGVNEHFRRLAARLAGWGYAVLVPDLYRRFPEERRVVAYSDRETAMGNLSRLKDEEAKEDISRCLDILRSDPRVDRDRIGVVGFCMGGRLAFLSAGWFGEKIKAAVPFYGGGIGAPKGFFLGIRRCPSRWFREFGRTFCSSMGGRMTLSLKRNAMLWPRRSPLPTVLSEWRHFQMPATDSSVKIVLPTTKSRQTARKFSFGNSLTAISSPLLHETDKVSDKLKEGKENIASRVGIFPGGEGSLFRGICRDG